MYEVLIDKTGEIFIGHCFTLDFGSDLLQNYWKKAVGPADKQKERSLPYKLKKESSRLVEMRLTAGQSKTGTPTI